MADFAIDLRLPEVHDRLNKLGRDQIPFATALALTWTANDARDDVRQGLPDRFVIRSTWLSRGIQTKPATKRHPQATVLSRDEFMVRQEHGGTKKPRKEHLALPSAKPGSPRQERITRSQRPAKVLKKRKAFVQMIDGNPEVLGIFIRQGRWRHPMTLLYFLYPRAGTIHKKFGMSDTVNETVLRRFERNFGKALARSISSAVSKARR